jgi:hypothetical protein
MLRRIRVNIQRQNLTFGCSKDATDLASDVSAGACDKDSPFFAD